MDDIIFNDAKMIVSQHFLVSNFETNINKLLWYFSFQQCNVPILSIHVAVGYLM